MMGVRIMLVFSDCIIWLFSVRIITGTEIRVRYEGILYLGSSCCFEIASYSIHTERME